MSGLKAEIAAVQSHIRDIEASLEVTTEVALELKATTNYDTDVWANRGLLILPIALSWLWVRSARKRGYWEQRQVRLAKWEGGDDG